jgi:hypothetical protein
LNPIAIRSKSSSTLFRYATPGGFLSLRSFYEDRGMGKPFFIIPAKLNGDFKLLCTLATDAAQRAANAADKIVFAPPIATFRDARKATEKDIAEGLVLSVECDKHPDNARERLEEILGAATIIVRSGGRTADGADKLHAHWRLAETVNDKATLAKLNRARDLAARIVGGDPSGKSVVHPYRWPGSWHRKGEPRLCEIATANPDAEIVLEEALEALEDAADDVIPEDDTTRASNNDNEQRVEWDDAFRKILSGEEYHPTLVPLAASLASWGAPEPVTDNVLRCLLLNSTPRDPERLRRRDAELAKLPQSVASAYTKFGKADAPEQKQERLRWHGEHLSSPDRGWLVSGLLPEGGVGLISGQWGTYKTFVALDLAAAIMTGLAFIDYPIVRKGGILFIAAEGANEIPARLEAVLKNKYPDQTNRLPFAWTDECPRLLGPKAVETLADLAREAAERMQKDFCVPLALIVIDTMVDAAGYTRSGDENDAALGQLIMRRCAELSRRCGALVLGVDHFGKATETGTRGSSAKEGRADVVLALLGDKAISGEVTNTRLAVRKNRAGPGGRELPFTVRSVDMGSNENGEPITSLVIEWMLQAPPRPAPAKGDDWGRGKAVKLLRKIIMSLMIDAGAEIRPFADGPTVRALKVDLVQAEFSKRYFGGGETAGAKRRARWAAFQRAMNEAADRGVVVIREIDGEDFVWLAAAGPAEKT